jgi:hypothetical protein
VAAVVTIVIVAWARLSVVRTMVVANVAGRSLFWFAMKINDVFGHFGTTAASAIIVAHDMTGR